MQNKILIPTPKNTVLVVVDVQEKLLKAMDPTETLDLLKKIEILTDSCAKLGLTTIFTEQYPKGLGNTVQELKNYILHDVPFEKTSFSCFGSTQFCDKIKNSNAEAVIICGIETHVCIQQTAFDALNIGLQVFIPADAVASRKKEEKEIALRYMQSNGIHITSVESIIFALMRDSTHPQFREISKKFK